MAEIFIVQAMPTSNQIPAGDSKPVKIPAGKCIQITVPPGSVGAGFVKFISKNGVQSIAYPQGAAPYPQFDFTDEIGVFFNEPVGPNPPTDVIVSAV